MRAELLKSDAFVSADKLTRRFRFCAGTGLQQFARADAGVKEEISNANDRNANSVCSRRNGGDADGSYVNKTSRCGRERFTRQQRLRSSERAQDVLGDPRHGKRRESTISPASRRRIDH
jgi:hypothetical protein